MHSHRVGMCRPTPCHSALHATRLRPCTRCTANRRVPPLALSMAMHANTHTPLIVAGSVEHHATCRLATPPDLSASTHARRSTRPLKALTHLAACHTEEPSAPAAIVSHLTLFSLTHTRSVTRGLVMPLRIAQALAGSSRPAGSCRSTSLEASPQGRASRRRRGSAPDLPEAGLCMTVLTTGLAHLLAARATIGAPRRAPA